MPANAGIQVRFRFNFENRLDSGFRRNDGNKNRLPVDKLKTPRLGAEGCSVAAVFKRLTSHAGVTCMAKFAKILQSVNLRVTFRRA